MVQLQGAGLLGGAGRDQGAGGGWAQVWPSSPHPPGSYKEGSPCTSPPLLGVKMEVLSWGRRGGPGQGLGCRSGDLGWLHGGAGGSEACEALGSVTWGRPWKIPPAGHTQASFSASQDGTCAFCGACVLARAFTHPGGRPVGWGC